MQTQAPIECKCCHGEATFYGNIDFNKTCVDRYGERLLPVSKTDVPYWVCGRCGFIFTNLMDGWSADDFRREIYNDDYAVVDPPIFGRIGVEPRETPAYQTGTVLSSLLNQSQDRIRILDFGSGGNPGPTGLALLDNGFDLRSYDAYRADVSEVPQEEFDVILAIEVFEHCHDLEDLVQFMQRHLKPQGIIWIETALHEYPTPSNVLDSWYIAPRNGHISIFTFVALAALFRAADINIVRTLHGTVGFKNLPDFPNQIFV